MCMSCNRVSKPLHSCGTLERSSAIESYLAPDLTLETHEELKKAFEDELKQLGLD